jgi:hypothetical protein
MIRASTLVVKCSENNDPNSGVQTAIRCRKEEDDRNEQDSKDLGSLYGNALRRNGTAGFVKSVFSWTVSIALIRDGEREQ